MTTKNSTRKRTPGSRTKPAKRRTKTSRSRKAARKPTTQARRKPAVSQTKHPSPPASRTPISSITAEQQIVGAVFLGKVINYYSHLKVAILVLEAPLAVGDTIRVKGHTTDLTQRIDSLQVAYQSVQSASAGEGVGLKLADRVRTGDAVFKI
ncbi:MAG: hypothetical protein HZB91_05380 [Elusimicrobia bacterium]|nr:hypothetical protein [Elusimicrobiota bacterium]